MATDVDELVEYALVGALLRDPDQLNRMPWLTRDDFATVPAQQVYFELRRQHDLHAAAPHTPSPTAESVADHLVGMTVPAIHHADLNHMLTRTPPAADPIAYGRIVLEESIRSAVRELGARVADTPCYDPKQVSVAAVTAVAAVEQLQRRWELSEPPTGLPAPLDAVPEPRLGAWLPDQRPQFERIRAAERTVAAAAANVILEPAAVTAALHPNQLHDPGAALAITAISVLLADRRPVDPVIVSWQQQRLLGDRDFSPLSWPELQAPTRATTADALSVLRADRAHELIYRAPDTLHRDAARHDQPLRQVLAAAAATLTDLSEAVTGHGLPRLGPAPNSTAPGTTGPDAPGWGWLADRIDPRLRTGRDWPALAVVLDRAYADGYDVAADLPRLAARTPLPDRHPARDLQYRLLDDCPAAVTPVPISTRIAHEHAPAAGTAPTRPPQVQPAPAPVRVPGPRR